MSNLPSIGILHYSAPPVVGGVEAVINAQSSLLLEHGYPTTVIAGRGSASALPDGIHFIEMPALDSQNLQILATSQELIQGRVPPDFDVISQQVEDDLRPVLREQDILIVHNVLTKHFNLPLTAALFRLISRGDTHGVIAWCHDLTWTSPHSRSQVHPGYPWDLLRRGWPGVAYVTVSEERRQELAGLFEWPEDQIRVIYNGVNPDTILGLSAEGRLLIDRLRLQQAGLVLLLPVRITQAKNIEYALRVVAALAEAGCEPRLIVTGPPDPHDPENTAYFHSLLELRDLLGLHEEARFVYESSIQPGEPYFITSSLVAELYRSSDLLFMPSHREGFGMPVLEAGLIGLPIISAPFPAAMEIGGQDILIFDPEKESPIDLAERIRRFADSSPVIRLRRRVRKELTWEAIFNRQIQPLLLQVGER